MDRFSNIAAFVKVVDAHGFSAAARRLNTSTTTVSDHVLALEDRLGVRLLNRTTRKISLTEVGRAYNESCTAMLGDLEHADQNARSVEAAPRGTLRLYMGSHIVRFLCPVIVEYLAQFQEVTADLAIGEWMVDLLDEGHDLAIRTSPSGEASLIVRKMARWRRVLCCSPAYLDAHDAPATIGELAQHKCLRYGFYPDWHFAEPDGKAVTVRPRGPLIGTSGDTMRIAALRGLGIFLAPAFVAGNDFAAGKLVPILSAYRPTANALDAVYPHRHLLSAKVRTFLDLLARRTVEHRQWREPDFGIGGLLAPEERGSGT